MIDPQTGAELPRTSPRLDPNRPIDRDPEERRATFLLPVALAVLVLLGIGYFFYGTAPTTGPNVRADSGVTVPSPSPN